MDGLRIFLVILLVASCSHDWISGSVLEATFGPGDNITLYCDCKSSTGVSIVWYRNCSHENQPALVLKVNFDQFKITNGSEHILNPIPRFHFVRNGSSKSYDLLIKNATDSDEGLYYCGTEQLKVEDTAKITERHIYRYGNITRILFNGNKPQTRQNTQDCDSCRMLLYSLCPAIAVLSSVLSSLLVYHLCQKTDVPDTRGQTRGNKDEDVCYAALEIQQASQRPKKKKIRSSDFSTYSAINTCQL